MGNSSASSTIAVVTGIHPPGETLRLGSPGGVVITPNGFQFSDPSGGLKKILPNFNHYQTTSTLSFTEPVATSGYRTLVYEVPDLASNQDAQEKTKKLIGAIFSTLILI